MMVSLNSVVGFSSTTKFHPISSSGTSTSVLKSPSLFFPPSGITILRRPLHGEKWGLGVLVAKGDDIAADTSDGSSKNSGESFSDDSSSVVKPLYLSSSTGDDKLETGAEVDLGPQSSRIINGSVASDSKENESSANVKSTIKRSPLTAREKLRAARVLSRYTESKASKPEFGSKVLEALKESDRGKRKSGLPEAPTNLFDDSKRGLPKQGLTFEFPGGLDVFVIVFSFVFISTVMFATTYIVWKVGAIHFNEY